jgi:hypothetical protein
MDERGAVEFRRGREEVACVFVLRKTDADDEADVVGDDEGTFQEKIKAVSNH